MMSKREKTNRNPWMVEIAETFFSEDEQKMAQQLSDDFAKSKKNLKMLQASIQEGVQRDLEEAQKELRGILPVNERLEKARRKKAQIREKMKVVGRRYKQVGNEFVVTREELVPVYETNQHGQKVQIPTQESVPTFEHSGYRGGIHEEYARLKKENEALKAKLVEHDLNEIARTLDEALQKHDEKISSGGRTRAIVPIHRPSVFQRVWNWFKSLFRKVN